MEQIIYIIFSIFIQIGLFGFFVGGLHSKIDSIKEDVASLRRAVESLIERECELRERVVKLEVLFNIRYQENVE